LLLLFWKARDRICLRLRKRVGASVCKPPVSHDCISFRAIVFAAVVAQGVMRSDNYAFVLMKDEEGYRRATQQAVRLFGIQIEV
jgi:hypothetical protein